MSNQLCKNGYKVCLVTGFDKKKYIPEQNHTNMIYLPAINIPLIFRISLLFNSLFWILLYAKKDDIIILHPDSLWIAPFISIKGIDNIHLDIRTLPLTQNRSLKKRIDNWFFWTAPMRYLRGYVKGYSFITERLKAAIEDEFLTQFNCYKIWQSGVNIEKFKPIKANNNNQSRFVLFYHGSIYAHRGLEEIVEAVESLDNPYRNKIKLVIVGAGAGLKKLQHISNRYPQPSAVEYKGFVPYENIAAEISHADCCICPLPDLLQWNVSSPLKLLEYLASGKPAIVTQIPAHTDILKSEKFVVWTQGHQVHDFQRAIVFAYKNREGLHDAASKAPRFIASQYSWDILGKRFADYLCRMFPNDPIRHS